ncbi:interaptin-like [Melanotaenia boesemani]|uniref:interaptin-like n=1 Tax=Melanotaenia boesemani TaxID=1250792 RepID=UPI001C05ACA8|nr:interaptin-like [Melanotaenia boesemani]
MAYCLIPDFPTVMIALEHLKDLDKQLSEDGVSFAPEASIHLTEITAAITTVETERRTSHEHLEVETIENSKLRHQINNLLKRISEGIMADVAAVRASNAEEMDNLRKDLSTAYQLQEETMKRLQTLLSQNKILQPEREQVQAEKDAIVATLNDQLILKYNLKMQLDQTQEMIEELKSAIVAVEQKQVALQQNRILEREAFPEKKDTLSREMDQTGEEINQQKQAITRRRQELERVNMRREKTLSHLDELNIHMGKLESSVQKRMASRCHCEQQLEEEIQKHQELKQRETLRKELHELRETFNHLVQNLQNEIAKVDDKKEKGQESRLLIQGILAGVQKVFKHHQDEENNVRAEYLHVSQQLERSKLQLEERIAGIVKHSKGTKEMEKEIKELQEADAINRLVFKRNQEELCIDMNAEKKNISQSEEEKRQLCQLLEEAAQRQKEHVAKMTLDISKIRSRYEELLEEEAALHQRHPESSDVDMLMSHVTQSEVEYRQIESIHRQEMQQCVAEAESISQITQEKQRALQVKEEMLKEVEVKFNEEQSRLERLDAHRFELNSKRSELSLSIQGKKEQISSLLQPKEDMKTQLENLQSYYIDMLDNQVLELRALEVGIYNNSVKLEEVNMENSRLHLRIKQMMEDISTTTQQKERNQKDIQQLSHNIKVLLESLQEAWRQDLLVTQDCQSRDGALLALMSSLLNLHKTRKQQLANVSTLLHQQMLDFSRWLGDEATLEQHNLQYSECMVTSEEASQLCN